MNQLAALLAPLFLSAIALQAILKHFGGVCEPMSVSMERDDEEEGDDVDVEEH